MPALTLQHKNKTLGEYQLQKGVSLSIGRRDSNDVVIEDPAVSGHHAKIDALGDRFVLIDLQSKNGSFVNEQLVTSHWLQHGDVITIGGHSLVFQRPDEVEALSGDSDDFDETQALNNTQRRKMMMQSHPTKSIHVTRYWDKGQKRGKLRDLEPDDSEFPAEGKEKEPIGFLSYLAGGKGQIELTKQITSIGKDPTSDIVIKGLLINPTAVIITKKADGFYLSNIGGRPKPKVNDEPVKKSISLYDQDIIEIGSVKLLFSIETQ
ncbi:MAG: FHA domain-containing protein [Desulfobacterales bacterium]|jgi:pSer/pThr/pTyr-binding forkhead associated (FHA) protein